MVCAAAVAVAGAQLNYSQIEIYSQEVVEEDARIVFARSTALLTPVHRAKSEGRVKRSSAGTDCGRSSELCERRIAGQTIDAPTPM